MTASVRPPQPLSARPPVPIKCHQGGEIRNSFISWLPSRKAVQVTSAQIDRAEREE
jgi:hypothetical protein